MYSHQTPRVTKVCLICICVLNGQVNSTFGQEYGYSLSHGEKIYNVYVTDGKCGEIGSACRLRRCSSGGLHNNLHGEHRE